MLIVSPSTASALASHTTTQTWVMFVQAVPPSGSQGPVLIEGIKGTQLGARLRDLSTDNAFEVVLIGLIESPTPDEHADAIAEQYAADGHLHDDWYKATPGLLAFVQHHAQEPLRVLLSQTHPGSLSDTPVDINTIAKMLGVSVVTVRRMVARNAIPFLRWGAGRTSSLRFVPTDVVASLQQRRR